MTFYDFVLASALGQLVAIGICVFAWLLWSLLVLLNETRHAMAEVSRVKRRERLQRLLADCQKS